MSKEAQERLQALNADYASVTGQAFDHFFCPILHRDEDVDLCRGHVLNQSFGAALNRWVVQRRDVDNFFGSRFEADITKLKYRDALRSQDVLGDHEARRKLRPRIFAGDQEVEYFVPERSRIESTSALDPDAEDGAVIALKISREDLARVEESEWRMETNLDLRVGSVVSLLKAAHLTMFALLGYRYALSPSGILVGRQILGRLFDETHDKPSTYAVKLVRTAFKEIANLVRPIVEPGLNTEGTILDGRLAVAWSTRGFPWAKIVHVPTGSSLNSVMLPICNSEQAFRTWIDFMVGSDEWIRVKYARIDFDRGGEILWNLSKATYRVRWPKGRQATF